MASVPSENSAPRGLAALVQRFVRARGGAQAVDPRIEGSPAIEPRRDGDEWGHWINDQVSLQFLNGTDNRGIRSRQQIYETWQRMLADPIITSALRLHVTAALGGHETRGEMIFIEPSVSAKKSKKSEELVAGIAKDLQPIFNKVAPTLCFNACAFGDAYARLYAEPKLGLRDVYVDELVYPPLFQPYERGNVTIGYRVATGSRFSERLTVLQVARMKMPRTLYMPQDRVVEKALFTSLTTDRVDDLPAVPSLAGGSFLDGAELAYERFNAAWIGLVGQRVSDSIDETILSVQQDGMTREQRSALKTALTRMFERSNAYINSVVKGGKSVFGRIIHFIPVATEKQLAQVTGSASPGRTSSLSIDDVMMHARFLAGSLGLDLSMIGFSDQLAGGLGEGGFFRVSAQSAERSRMIRAAVTECLNHAISVHVLMKHGIDLHGQDLPWIVNFASGISALEREKADTKAQKVNSAALIVQTMAQLKDLGLSKDAMAQFLQTEMDFDADAAKLYAEAIYEAKPAEGDGGFGGGFGEGGVGEIVPPSRPAPAGGE